jgi:release factor glutamine methyltransferase
MKTSIRNIVAHTYKPFLEKYLSRKRTYRYGNLELEIPPEVFHPGFFFSTHFLLQYVKKLSLNGKKFLEMGAGNGLISIYAAKQGAKVTAIDINPVAVDFLQTNSVKNKAHFTIILSDLFQNIPVQKFDIIAVNPPYYKKNPKTPREYAWYCGENGEFFSKFFTQLPGYIHKDSEIIMTLCDGCDREMIEEAATTKGFKLICLQSKRNLIENNFIYKIEKN